jgi:hypothetical protein
MSRRISTSYRPNRQDAVSDVGDERALAHTIAYMRTASTLVVLLFLGACGGKAAPEEKVVTPPKEDKREPKADAMVGVHGMLVFGIGTKFVSHLPTYQQPHNVQAIAEINLLQEPGKFDDGLFAKPHPSGYHTIRPEPFSLPKIQEQGFRFPATLYAGHFEREGHVEIGAVVVEIKRPIVYRELPSSGGPESAYPALVFGSAESGEFYMAHKIGPKPSFDQISLIAEGAKADDPAWANGTEVQAVAHSDEPIRRYGKFSFQMEGSPRQVKTRGVYTEVSELQ